MIAFPFTWNRPGYERVVSKVVVIILVKADAVVSNGVLFGSSAVAVELFVVVAFVGSVVIDVVVVDVVGVVIVVVVDVVVITGVVVVDVLVDVIVVGGGAVVCVPLVPLA